MPIAKVNGINLYYNSEGQGEPLVMIMGLGSTAAAWRFQIRHFRKDFRVITLDNRGAGQSDKPPGPYSLEQMADDTVALLDHLSIKKAHIMGVSMGGKIAQFIAVNHPDRVDKLVLANTYCCQDDTTNGWTPEWKAGLERYCQTRQPPSVKLGCNNPVLQLLMFCQLRISAKRKTAVEWAAYVSQARAAAAVNTGEKLAAVKAPTLVITGTGDKLTRHTSSDTMAKLIPNAKLVKFKGGSHTLVVEKYRRFNREVMSFLKE